MQIGNTIQSNVSNVAYVGDIGDVVCGFHANVYRSIVHTIKHLRHL